MAPRDRWLIEGHLTTRTPLHVGSGGTTERPGLEDDDGRRAEIDAVATDHCGQPYIPGTALKGDLRALARVCGVGAELGDVFGRAETDKEKGTAGRAVFWDAPLLDCPPPSPPPPHWSSERSTGVAISVAIDRWASVAAEDLLIHREYVPPGARFAVGIAGRLDRDEVVALLSLLATADDMALGARTGDGWGRVSWRLTGIKRMNAEGARRWLALPPPTTGWAALEPVPFEERQALEAATARLTCTDTTVTLYIRLEFLGRFLVNDPSQCGRGEGLPDHAPRLDAAGRPFLPASSFRGAFRSQAERILRTLGRRACWGKNGCRIEATEEGEKKLCDACRVFGATGWRAPVSFTDFVGPSRAKVHQEFVAIDRFTGGSTKKLKFDALTADRPVLEGQLRVDLEALERIHAGPWALGLLALTLRDLIEGDIRFGFGAAKGFGECRASIQNVSLPPADQSPASFRPHLEHSLELGSPPRLSPALKATTDRWLAALQKRVKEPA